MKVLIFYRPKSEHARAVEEFLHDFKRQHGDRKIEIINPDSIAGASKAALYDVMDYPAFLAVDESGSLLKSWQGSQWPLMNELAYYAV